MSRPIEFRARALVNDKYNGIEKGDLVYGSFVESGCDAPCIIFGDGEQIEIDRETLGQYTGLTDKNGKKVFEGDIICQNDSSKKRYSVVEFCSHLKSASRDSPSTFNTGYYACTQGGYKLGFQEGFTVEGNVYENPGLLNANSNT